MRHRHFVRSTGYTTNRQSQSKPTPRIFYFHPAKKWAISVYYLKGEEMKNFLFFLKNKCSGEYHIPSKTWLVPESALDDAKRFVERYYGHYEFVPKIELPPPVQQTKRDRNTILQEFCRLAQVELSQPTQEELKLAYRRAAIRLHPDRGGDGQLMSDLNVCYKELQQLTM